MVSKKTSTLPIDLIQVAQIWLYAEDTGVAVNNFYSAVGFVFPSSQTSPFLLALAGNSRELVLD